MGRYTADRRRYDFINNLIRSEYEYVLTDWDVWDYSILRMLNTLSKTSYKDNRRINDVIIMADTETSKNKPTRYVKKKDGTKKPITQENHLVCWTITIRAYGYNIVTLRGRRPSEFGKCMARIADSMPGDVTYFFMHNLAYDWTFLERFIIKELGVPEKLLATKPHYPIQIEFKGGMILRDSLILLQRSLEKVAADLGVEHQKAVGSWDYDKIRHQNTKLSDTEWSYAEFDTLSGAECIEAYCKGLDKNLATLPLTATGIPRGEARTISKEFRWFDKYRNITLTYEQYDKVVRVYHGGYTHGNRHYIDIIIRDPVRCYDFASSYPYTLCAYKFPMTAFKPVGDIGVDDILKNMEEYAFFFRCIMVKPQLKENGMPMPYLQLSKCEKSINAVVDNGRIINAEYAEIWLTEYDLAILVKEYKFKAILIRDAETAQKQYLPRWFTDYVFKLFTDKTRLKGGDPVLYALAKAKLNSLYGMCVQHVIRDEIEEDYETGEYKTSMPADPEALYKEEIHKRSMFLPYQWGVWVTAIATYNLFKLGRCCETWYYSDTDSCYGAGWDEKAVKEYNKSCIERLKANGYGGVEHNGRTYYLGVAESEGDKDLYTEFKILGAKRYCGRCVADGKLHLTVAGVPKKLGAECLQDDIENFKPDFVFSGSRTGKKTHTYIYNPIHIDSKGNECANSVDLTECDYKIDRTDETIWEDILFDDIEIIQFEED